MPRLIPELLDAFPPPRARGHRKKKITAAGEADAEDEEALAHSSTIENRPAEAYFLMVVAAGSLNNYGSHNDPALASSSQVASLRKIIDTCVPSFAQQRQAVLASARGSSEEMSEYEMVRAENIKAGKRKLAEFNLMSKAEMAKLLVEAREGHKKERKREKNKMKRAKKKANQKAQRSHVAGLEAALRLAQAQAPKH